MLSMQKEEPLSLPMYHVLEGPTPVVCAPDTQGTEVCVCVCVWFVSVCVCVLSVHAYLYNYVYYNPIRL